MYGLIGKMTAVSGQRDALAAILLEGVQSMPGCLSYVVATDTTDPGPPLTPVHLQGYPFVMSIRRVHHHGHHHHPATGGRLEV